MKHASKLDNVGTRLGILLWPFLFLLTGIPLGGCETKVPVPVRSGHWKNDIRLCDEWPHGGPFADIEVNLESEQYLRPSEAEPAIGAESTLWVRVSKPSGEPGGATKSAPQRGSCVFVWPKDLNTERGIWAFEYVVAEDLDIPPRASSPEYGTAIQAGEIEDAPPEEDILFAIRQRVAEQISHQYPSCQFGSIFFLGGFPGDNPPPAHAKQYLLDFFPSEHAGSWNWALKSLGKRGSVFADIPGGRIVRQVTVPAEEYVKAFFVLY